MHKCPLHFCLVGPDQSVLPHSPPTGPLSLWDCWGFSLLRFGFGLEVPRTKPGPVRGWQVSAAALSGGLGSLPSTQKEQEQTAIS